MDEDIIHPQAELQLHSGHVDDSFEERCGQILSFSQQGPGPNGSGVSTSFRGGTARYRQDEHHHQHHDLLLHDRLLDDLGRVLDAFPDNHPFSVCPTPRAMSPALAPPTTTAVMTISTSSKKKKISKIKIKMTDFIDEDFDIQATVWKVPIKSKKRSLNAVSESVASHSSSSLSTSANSSLGDARDLEEDRERIPQTKKKTKSAVSYSEGIGSRGDAAKKSSSLYRGVSLCAKDSRWQARIRIQKEVVYLGRYETEEGAARKYDDAAREHHGDKALLNFITPADRALGRKSVFEQEGGKSARA